MKRTTNNSQGGFTLIELLLAMAFFGSVLIVATLLLTQTLNIYNRGMTVKQMNQVGRTLVEDMTRVGNSGASIQTGTDTSGAINCISIDKTTYVWNIADPSPSNTTSGYKLPYFTYDNSSNTPINFVKLTDANINCTTLSANRKISEQNSSPMIGDTVRVYQMSVSQLSGTHLLHIVMLLGTFDAVGSEYNLYDNGGNLECRVGGVGNFCSKANFDTVLYVPNGEFN